MRSVLHAVCSYRAATSSPPHALSTLVQQIIPWSPTGSLSVSSAIITRAYAGVPSDNSPREALDIFDRHLVSRHRDRAAYLGNGDDPLQSMVTERLLDRLEDCVRKFPTALVLGGAAQQVITQLAGGRAGVERIIYVDSSLDMLRKVQAASQSVASSGGKPWPRIDYVLGDEEYLPIRHNSVDLVVSSLGLHWVNDLPDAMLQCQKALRPDCLFLGAMFGGETLSELRIACSLAQMEREGGVSPVISPLAQVRDCGNLLMRAGLAMPTVDIDSFRMAYPSPLEVIHHLRSMGESNAVAERRSVLRRPTAIAAYALYQSMFGEPDGSVPATYQVVYMTGWSPHESQPKAARRGSATVSFQELATGLAGVKPDAVASEPAQPASAAAQ